MMASTLPPQPAWRAVEPTARDELELALADWKAPPPIVLGTLAAVPADRDAFEVRLHDGTLSVLGNTPRGLLHAVFALHEALAAGDSLNEGFHCQPVQP